QQFFGSCFGEHLPALLRSEVQIFVDGSRKQESSLCDHPDLAAELPRRDPAIIDVLGKQGHDVVALGCKTEQLIDAVSTTAVDHAAIQSDMSVLAAFSSPGKSSISPPSRRQACGTCW